MYDGHGDGDDDDDPIDLFSELVGIKTCPCLIRCACVQFQIEIRKLAIVGPVVKNLGNRPISMY